MAKVLTLYAPVKTTITPTPGTVARGTVVTIDTNVPATVFYTLDGSAPEEGEFGTFRGEAPVEIELGVSTTLRYKARDSRSGEETNATKTQKAVYAIVRNRALEDFRANRHFFLRLNRAIVDENFFIGPTDWVVPVSKGAMTLLFVNREPFTVRVRILQNGADILQEEYPVLTSGGAYEFQVHPASGENDITVFAAKLGDPLGPGPG